MAFTARPSITTTARSRPSSNQDHSHQATRGPDTTAKNETKRDQYSPSARLTPNNNKSGSLTRRFGTTTTTTIKTRSGQYTYMRKSRDFQSVTKRCVTATETPNNG